MCACQLVARIPLRQPCGGRPQYAQSASWRTARQTISAARARSVVHSAGSFGVCFGSQQRAYSATIASHVYRPVASG